MQFKREKPKSFWITSLKKKIVNIPDLGIYIYPFRSINLLDQKHYKFTPEQLNKSAENGSLFERKRAKQIAIRDLPPEIDGEKHKIYIQENSNFPTRQRSSVEIKDVKYEELDVSDDAYAEENADFADQDHTGKWKK